MDLMDGAMKQQPKKTSIKNFQHKGETYGSRYK